jgi:subtilisin family serine protease
MRLGTSCGRKNAMRTAPSFDVPAATEDFSKSMRSHPIVLNHRAIGKRNRGIGGETDSFPNKPTAIDPGEIAPRHRSMERRFRPRCHSRRHCRGSDDSVTLFSNSGNHIVLSAPGKAIWSTLPTYPGQTGFAAVFGLDGQPRQGKPMRRETDYDAWDGTSMATPHVTGSVALLLASQRFADAVGRQG